MLHIREGKGKKDRYVPLGNMLCRGLKVYIENEHPFNWLFNGKSDTGQLQQFSNTGVQWIIRQAHLKTAIKKQVTSHILRHTYATHLLEMGTDIISLKELLGHTDIELPWYTYMLPDWINTGHFVLLTNYTLQNKSHETSV